MSALEDYKQLFNAYPNANRFLQALRGNIEKHVPTQADLEDPQSLGKWSLDTAMNSPMGLVYGGMKKAPVVMQSIEDYVGHHTAPTREFGAPLHDMTGGGEFYPEDIYSNMGYHYYGEGRGAQDKMLFAKIKALRNKPEQQVEVYRAVPNDSSITSINHGDWITIDPQYAKEHGQGPLGNDYKILKAKVPAKAIYTNADSPYEYGLDLSVLESK